MIFRHSGWWKDRELVRAALEDVFPGSARLDRFVSCGSNAWVIHDQEQPERYAVVSDHCRDRFCRPCARFRGTVMAHNVKERLTDRKYRFATFTIRTVGLTLKQGIAKLYRAFAMIRRTNTWTANVTGGGAFIEVKRTDDGKRWHPHLHCLLEGNYVPYEELRKHWLRITGDSYIVDIKKGEGPEKAAWYVTKYVTKPIEARVQRDPALLREAIEALHGRRMCATFGTWTGMLLTHYRPSGVWVKVTTLWNLRYRATHGDEEALRLLEFLTASQPYREVPRPRSRSPAAQEPALPRN